MAVINRFSSWRNMPSNNNDGEMLGVLKKGLPKTQSPKHVLILGAGMAGLVAGYLLKQAGHSISIIEGNTRIGGRVYTVRAPFSNRNYFEAGAMRIPGHHRLTMELIRQFGLSVIPFIGSTENDLIFVNDQLVRRYQYEENPRILRFPLPEHEADKTAFQLLETALQPFIDLYRNVSEIDRNILIERFDQYSFGSFLRENPLARPLSSEAIYKIEVILGIEGFPELSFIDIFRNVIDTIFREDIQFYEILGGNDQLPKSFLPFLRENIYYDQTVQRIEQSPTSVEVITKSSGRQIEATFSGDTVITTIPFSAFQFVNIVPYESVSFLKREVIKKLHYVSAMKIGLEFEEKFWEELSIRGGSLITDLPIKTMYYPSHNIGDPGSDIILGSYTWGDNARVWEPLSEEERITQALRYLTEIYGESVLEYFLEGMSFSWGNNPFSAGCFSLYAPYQVTRYEDIIKKPEGLLHFAGEHTSEMHGWIEGAVESGIRAAIEVNERR
ncbi:flavin monoamine oxidase family protein [Evansella halocellulosilytica]|uniref:flavin monoamine oxidase family protein n=1 Tax=Evansella halocellulosilytica TaxID=2011013 RepID=UPI00211C8245|nr:flavin monoamine oxidase family protein [Evansella halocellulosilytica]